MSNPSAGIGEPQLPAAHVRILVCISAIVGDLGSNSPDEERSEERCRLHKLKVRAFTIELGSGHRVIMATLKPLSLSRSLARPSRVGLILNWFLW